MTPTEFFNAPECPRCRCRLCECDTPMPPDQMSEMPDDDLAALTRRYWPLIDRARREENEACARVADEYAASDDPMGREIAAAIRARVK
jgi:hypothetical protein